MEYLQGIYHNDNVINFEASEQSKQALIPFLFYFRKHFNLMTCILKVFSGPFVQVSQMIFPGPIFVQVSRIIFPMGFAVFNISYWVYYLHIIAVSHQWYIFSCLYINSIYFVVKCERPKYCKQLTHRSSSRCRSALRVMSPLS